MRKLLSVLSSTLQGGVRGGLLFVALLATTALWAQRFQVGDLYYEYSELPDVEPISGAVTIVWNPVGFVPCIENGSQLVLVGNHNSWGSELTKRDYFEAIDGAPGWYKVVVTGSCSVCKPCALAPDGSFSWEYEWIDLPGAPCEILASSDPDVHLADGGIIIPNYSTPIVYICSWGFKNNPCPENVGEIIGEIIGEVVVTSEFEGWSDKNYQNLSTAYIPETVVYNGKTYEVVGIDDYAFANSPITSITIPNSVTSIGNGAFNGCKSLTSITIPNSVTNIGIGEYNYGCWEGLFSGCSSLKSIIVKEGNPVYDSRNNCNAIVETATNTLVVGCQSTNMPSSITSIGPGAFAGLENLTSIYIPNSIMSIGNAAFQNCFTLTSITITNSVTSIGSNAFHNCNSLKSITIPNSVTSIGYAAFEDCDSLTSVTIGNSITSIASCAFRACSSLTSAALGNSVTRIESHAFDGCSSLTSITIPNSVTSIGWAAFNDCEKLGTVSLGDKIKEIEDYAFKECNKLYHIYCYAPEPPIAEENIFTNYNVNLYVPCNYLDNYKYDRVFGSFRYIQCIESEDVTTNDVVVNPGANDVTITWPTEGNADTYTIVIKKGNEVFCTLTFNAEGQLLNIAFAPGRNGNHPAQYAEQAGNGYRFTVTGLEEGTHYAYNIDVKDAADKTIKSYTGEFTTESMTAVENITTNNANIQKILRDGQLLILRDGVEYTVMGQEL